MASKWIIAITIFLVSNFLYWKITNRGYKKNYSKKEWKRGEPKLYYWQTAIYASAGITVLLILLFKKMNILGF